MTNTPTFSIIIPTLNEEKTVGKLLKDLTKQSFQNFEVIVADGHSADKTVEVAQTFSKRLTLRTVNSDIRQVCYQRNLGAQSAQSDQLIFMDADNRLPDYFLQGIKYRLEYKDADIATTWINAGAKLDQQIAYLSNLFIESQKMTSSPYCVESMLIFKRKTFERLKGFDSSLPVGEGSEILKRAVRKGYTFKVYKDPQYTYSFRRLKKQGTLNSIRSTAQIELSRLFNLPISKEQLMKLYPMEGGAFFEQKEETYSRLKNLFEKFMNLPR